VVGTLESLQALRDAIDKALVTGQASSMTAYVNDGEGYVLVVLPQTKEEVDALQTPYTEDFAHPSEPSGKHPSQVVGSDKYRELMRV
jgi:hypothetical protein